MKRSALVLVLAVLPAAFANANLIVNGSFETPDIPNRTWDVSTTIPGWESTFGPGIEIQDNAAGSPFHGDQHVELDSHFSADSNSNMRQLIPVITGQSYDLSFAWSPRPGVEAESLGLKVLFGGVLLDTISGNGIGLTDTNWSVSAYTVTPNSDSVYLEFQAVGTADSYGSYIDDVRLTCTPIPAPGAVLLGTLGTGLVGWMRRRRTL